MSTKIKICGLRRPEDIEMINLYKPDYCGFIINFPKSHRSIEPEKVRTLCAGLDRENVKAVGVFVNSPPEEVAELLLDGTIDIAQLHGSEGEEYIREIKRLTGKPVIKAFKVEDINSLKKAAGSCADYVLLDQGAGGTGQTFDWSILNSKEAKEIFAENADLSSRWFLAGGISKDNIEEAVRRFEPFAVDLSSAVETEKVKDAQKVKEIIEIIRKM